MSRSAISRGAALGALAATIAAGVAAAAVSGNARSIAFERAAYAADNRAPGYGLVETGYFAMRARRDAAGRLAHFALDWGTGVVPRGFEAAIGSASYALRGGRVSGVSFVVSPAAGRGPDVPVEIVTTRSGVFWRAERSRGCFVRWKVDPSFERAVGTPLFVISGRFVGPPDRYTTALTVGTRVQTIHATSVQRVYPWGTDSQRATELDSFVTATKAVFASAISVEAGRAGHPGFTIEQAWSQARVTPTLPRVRVCR